MKKVLIIVDCQYDFVNPNGSLFVKGSEDLPERITGIMERFDSVVFTLDWHPYNHCSFKENGGQWPRHCVQYSKGASIPDILFNKLNSNQKYGFYKKGIKADKEEYGAFEQFENQVFLELLLREGQPDAEKHDIYVCGVAGDYCVAETTKQLMELVHKTYYKNINKVYLMKNLCPCIDTTFDIEAFAKEVGAKCVESKDIC